MTTAWRMSMLNWRLYSTKTSSHLFCFATDVIRSCCVRVSQRRSPLSAVPYVAKCRWTQRWPRPAVHHTTARNIRWNLRIYTQEKFSSVEHRIGLYTYVHLWEARWMASCKAEWKWVHRLLPGCFDAVVAISDHEVTRVPTTKQCHVTYGNGGERLRSHVDYTYSCGSTEATSLYSFFGPDSDLEN